MTKLVIFDLDGTLLDTVKDLGEAVNHALSIRSLPSQSMQTYRMLCGHGVRNLVRDALIRSLGEVPSDTLVDEALADFKAYYMDHIDDLTRPYDGIPEVLRTLQARGLMIAVASNKFQEGVERLVHGFFPDINFVAIFGNSPELPLKPDAAVVGLIRDKACVSREETVYVGDSGTDMQTAANGGVRSIGVSWGFRSRVALEQAGAGSIVDTREELLKLI